MNIKQIIIEEINNKIEEFKKRLGFHLLGGTILDSVENLSFFYDYFDGNIPQNLKYEGKLYRILQMYDKQQFNKILKGGAKSFLNQKYFSCSKTLEGIEEVKRKTWKKKYKYFVLFEFNVLKEEVLFDVNKVIDYIDLNENRFKQEEEVLVLSEKVPFLNPNNIIDFGKL